MEYYTFTTVGHWPGPTASNCRLGTSQHCCWVFISSGIFFFISHSLLVRFCILLFDHLLLFASSQSLCVFCHCSVAVSLACYYWPPTSPDAYYRPVTSIHFTCYFLLTASSSFHSGLRQSNNRSLAYRMFVCFRFLFLCKVPKRGNFQNHHFTVVWVSLFSPKPLLCPSTSTWNIDQRSVKWGTSPWRRCTRRT